MIFPETMGRFSVYLKQGGSYVLYCGPDEPFSEEHRRNLHDNGVEEVFVLSEHKERYHAYVEENLGAILADEGIALKERAKVFYTASVSIVDEVFAKRLPQSLDVKHFNRVAALVRSSARFLSMEQSLKTVASFVSHDYKTYSHCVQVFVYTMAVLSTYEHFTKESIFQCGLGAILHDLGKARIPKSVLNKRGSLTQEERDLVNTHPVQGVAMCTGLPEMGHEAINCVLFHHERMDGSGYPSGLKDEALPLPVRVIGVADVYDAIISNRSYAKAVSPFHALKVMRDEMKGAFDKEVFKRFIGVLSGANIV
ncbi:MAG: HD-GYP domain-containing protein [Desulfovibrio sp.]|nr:MAG: HD-GYP domain-containing protein [Desulfovibrio sp.]